MLAELNIQNFAIIDKLHLRLGVGFNALTGETGAGKSIIIDALGALLGSKIGPEFVRHGSPSARVEGQFDLATMLPAPALALRSLLSEGGLSDTEDGTDDSLIISREINSSGRTVARVNGRMVNLPTLQQIGELLVDVHGQSEHVSLLRSATHIDLLDEYAGLAEERRHVAGLVAQLRVVQKELRDLQRDERELARRADLLAYQVEEIEKASPHAGEDEELDAERTRLSNSERLTSLCDSIYALLIEKDDEGVYSARGGRGAASSQTTSVRDALGDASSMLAELARLDPTMEPHQPTLDAIYDTVEEIGRTMRVYREAVEHDPSRLEEIEERISLLHELKRKYGPSLQDVIAFGERAAHDLDSITHSEERVAALQGKSERLATEIGEVAARMSTARQEASLSLSRAVEESIKSLLMGSARFSAEVTQTEAAEGVPLPGRAGCWAYNDKGVDRVEFLISANPGEPLKPLAKIASGGETSRLMLALKSILSEADLTPTLVFDEVDVGVGGRSGGVVGEKLWGLTEAHQVLCITHLPQIAAFADSHFKITKQVVGDRTRTQVEELSPEERKSEVAAMIGGTPVSRAALENAREMMEEAKKFKEVKDEVQGMKALRTA
ncbi:MAG: DNA repair protein RecN [Chloroflexota bacterium]|nr:DNA repair protein RecN [Chloroflexota bacterium]